MQNNSDIACFVQAVLYLLPRCTSREVERILCSRGIELVVISRVFYGKEHYIPLQEQLKPDNAVTVLDLLLSKDLFLLMLLSN